MMASHLDCRLMQILLTPSPFLNSYHLCNYNLSYKRSWDGVAACRTHLLKVEKSSQMQYFSPAEHFSGFQTLVTARKLVLLVTLRGFFTAPAWDTDLVAFRHSDQIHTVRSRFSNCGQMGVLKGFSAPGYDTLIPVNVGLTSYFKQNRGILTNISLLLCLIYKTELQLQLRIRHFHR